MSRQPTPLCLTGAGMLGHTWFVTVEAREGGERLSLSCNDGNAAATYFDQHRETAIAIYTLKNGRFKRVSYTLAVIS